MTASVLSKSVVAAIKQLGIVSGRHSNLFTPNDTIMRAVL
ncbi:S-layer homology domain-containing protein [Paenibacillus lentus]